MLRSVIYLDGTIESKKTKYQVQFFSIAPAFETSGIWIHWSVVMLYSYMLSVVMYSTSEVLDLLVRD